MDDEGVEAVGMGWLCLRRTDRAEPTLRIEDWPYAIEQPVGAEVAAWADRAAALAQLLGAEGAATGAEQVATVRELLAEGWLTLPWEG